MAVLKRDELKGFFGEGQIPLSTHFEDLINSSISKADDGLEKEANEALKIQIGSVDVDGRRDGILLYEAFQLPRTSVGDPPVSQDEDQEPKWKISMIGSTSEGISGGLNIGDTTTDHLFIQEGTGNVGIGFTTDLNTKLSVNGGIKADSILIDGFINVNAGNDVTDSDSTSILLGTYNGKAKGAKIRFSGFESGGESESFEIGQDKDENNESNFFIKSGDLAPSLAILKNGQVTIGIPDVNVEVKGILKLGSIENLEATINDLLLNRSNPMIAENFEEGIVFKKTTRGMLVHTNDLPPFDSPDADRLVSEFEDDRWVFPTPEQLLDIYKNLHEGKNDSSGFADVVYLCKEADSFKGVDFTTGRIIVEADIDFVSTKIRPVRPF